MADLAALVAEVKAALQQATPGPCTTSHRTAVFGRSNDDAPTLVADCEPFKPHSPENPANAELIAHAPEWLGALVQAVEDQQREIARLGQIAKDYDASLRAMPFASETRAERDRLRAEVAQLRADGQRLREIMGRVLQRLDERVSSDEVTPTGTILHHPWPYDELVAEDRALVVSARAALVGAPPGNAP